MKFYVTATILALTVGAMSAAVPEGFNEALNVAVREAVTNPSNSATGEVRNAIIKLSGS
jgi:hypothetical protein